MWVRNLTSNEVLGSNAKIIVGIWYLSFLAQITFENITQIMLLCVCTLVYKQIKMLHLSFARAFLREDGILCLGNVRLIKMMLR